MFTPAYRPDAPTVMPALLLFFLACFSAGALAPPASAQIAVIVHPDNDVNELSRLDLKRLYSGEATTFSDLTIQRELSDTFFMAVMGKRDRAVRRLWVRVMLSGRVPKGPVAFRTDAEVIEYVARNPDAIGFVDLSSVNNQVKVVRVDGHGPRDAAYLEFAAE